VVEEEGGDISGFIKKITYITKEATQYG
jgi:hypothetical protein